MFLLDAKDDLFSFGDGQFMSNVSFFNQRDTAMLAESVLSVSIELMCSIKPEFFHNHASHVYKN